MKIYHYTTFGFFDGEGDADESPLEPGVYHIPAYATEIAPPDAASGQLRKFADGIWGYVPEKTPTAEPSAAPEPPVLTRIWKSNIWRDVTDTEAELLDASLNAQPAKLRRLWQDSAYITTTDPLFDQINGAVTALFGADRAAEILKPTE